MSQIEKLVSSLDESEEKSTGIKDYPSAKKLGKRGRHPLNEKQQALIKSLLDLNINVDENKFN